jgi:hypothetical protein
MSQSSLHAKIYAWILQNMKMWHYMTAKFVMSAVSSILDEYGVLKVSSIPESGLA